VFKQILIGSVIVLTMSGAALAHPHRQGGQRDQRTAQHHRRALMKRLNLTEQQRTQLRAIRERHRHELAPLRERMRAHRAELKRLDAERSGALRKEMQAMRQELRSHRQAMREEMRRVLTPEQRERLGRRH
jgi:Spy/CpxP family protein refolding chaperone